MIDKEKLKIILGYKTISLIKSALGIKKYAKALFGRKVHYLSYDKKIIDYIREIKLEGQHVFFGYYDIQQTDALGKRALFHIVNKNANPAKDSAKLAYVNIETGDIVVFAETRAWSWQQGARLRWHPQKDGVILYNDFDGEKYVTKEYDLENQCVVSTIPCALYDITPDGKMGLSLNFDRLQRLRPGYGYSCRKDHSEHDIAPAGDGIFLWRKETADVELIFSLSDLAADVPSNGAQHYVNHISISPSGEKFIFFHLWTFGAGSKWRMRLCYADVDGNSLECIDDTEIISHYTWKDEYTLLVTALANENSEKPKYIVYNLLNKSKTVIFDNTLSMDGHPTILGCSQKFISDTYSQSDSLQYVFENSLSGGEYMKLI